MTMTPDEIVRDFRNAKHPYKQITILAELNGCGKDNIIDVLRAQGLSEDEIYAGKPGRKVIPGRKATELTELTESVQAEEEAFEQKTVATERPDLSVVINVVKSRMSDITDKLESLTRERERLEALHTEISNSIRLTVSELNRHEDVLNLLMDLNGDAI